MAFLVFIAVVLVIAYRGMTPDERIRSGQSGSHVLRRLRQAITLRHRDLDAFHDSLDARTRLAPVTPILIAANLTLFVVMLFTSQSLSDPTTLVAWGGNFGPRTANGEWWRLVTALFVHAGWLHLLSNLVGLMQLGLVLERLVGPLAFASVYLGAGVLSGVAQLAASPVTVSIGAAGAIFGTYGLLLASWMGGLFRRVPATIPGAVAKRLAPAAAVFVLYNLATDTMTSAAALGGVIAGFAGGLVVARPVNDRKASLREIAAATAAVVAIAVLVAAPLRGMADVTPELQRVVTLEERTTTTFRAAVERFKNGTITADTLAEVIDSAILPELMAARARVESLGRVPSEQQTLVATCKEYLRLRDESWRVRSGALRGASMPLLREADAIESASLEMLRQIAADVPQG